MSYIIKTREDIERLKQFLELMRYKALSDKLIEETVAILSESMRTKPSVETDMMSAASLDPNTGIIKCNAKVLKYTIDHLLNVFNSKYPDYSVVRASMLMYLLAHEIEHYNQYLVSEGIENIESKEMARAYKSIYGLSKKSLLRVIGSRKRNEISQKYNDNKQDYFIERNAQIEAYDLIIQVLQDDYPELANEYKKLRDLYLAWGYDNLKGSVVNTLDELGMKNNFINVDDVEKNLSLDDRLRFGLPITKEEQEQVLGVKK